MYFVYSLTLDIGNRVQVLDFLEGIDLRGPSSDLIKSNLIDRKQLLKWKMLSTGSARSSNIGGLQDI